MLRSQPQTSLPGHVARVEMLSDIVTEERIAQVAFDQTGANVSVGEMAEVTLQLPSTARAALVPAASVQHLGGVTGVWRMESGKPQFAPVRLGSSSLDGQVQVLEGLRTGDTVVVYSQKALVAGGRVQVVESLVPAAAPASKKP